MCKLIIIPNAKNITDISVFSKDMACILSDMEDGYGYVAQGKDGVFGTKTLYPDAYAEYENVPDYVEDLDSSFGTPSTITGAAMFHGRISTNNISLVNTHPIIREDYFCVHNGVVQHKGESYQKLTTNDTEDLLYNFITGGIHKVASNLTGYYAGGIICPNGDLYVFKDNIAPLYYAFSTKLDSPILASTPAILEEIGTILGEELIGIKVGSDICVLFRDGKHVSTESFKSRGYDNYSASLAYLSLGKSLYADSPSEDLPSDSESCSSEGMRSNELCSDDYLDELRYMDDSYVVYDDWREISVKHFLSLNLPQKLRCKVFRCDGSKVEPFPESEERLA